MPMADRIEFDRHRRRHPPGDRRNGMVLQRDHGVLQKTDGAILFVGLGSRDALLKYAPTLLNLAKAGFDPNQPRDDDGRWTSGLGGGSAPANFDANAVARSVVASAGVAIGPGDIALHPPGWSIFGRINPATIDAVVAFASRLPGPVAFFSTLFVPRPNNLIADGTLPDTPEVRYHIDFDTGHFSLFTSDVVIAEGRPGADGLLRTDDGEVIGRYVDGCVILDAGALPTAKTVEQTDEAAGSRASAQARAVATTGEPQLCPDPAPDVKGFKSDRSIAYQLQVNAFVNPTAPIPPTFAVYLINPLTGRPVSYDDCFKTGGAMVDAKGPGYARLLNYPPIRAVLDVRFLKQAYRQLAAAGSRNVVWFVDEEETANHLRSLFDRADMRRISIVRLPMWPPFRKYIQDRMKAFLADHNSYPGETHELRDFCHAVS